MDNPRHEQNTRIYNDHFFSRAGNLRWRYVYFNFASVAQANRGLDEVSAIVLDVGSWTTRVGYAGEDTPKDVFSTYYGTREEEEEETAPAVKPETDAEGDTKMDNTNGNTTSSAPAKKSKKTRYFLGDNAIHLPRARTEIKNPMHEGIVDDWEAMEHVWEHALTRSLGADSSEHPLLVTEQPWNTRENRAQAMELAFETFQVPAFYIAKSPVASLFACGKGTGLVVDIGHDVVAVTPVIDGLPLYKPMRRSLYASHFLSREIRHMLQTQYASEPKETFGHIPTALNLARYQIKSRSSDLPLGLNEAVVSGTVLKTFPNVYAPGPGGPTESFHDFEVETRVVDEYKMTMCRVADTPFKNSDEKLVNSVSKREFEFPDGSRFEFGGKERVGITEALFKPAASEFQIPGFPIPSTATEKQDSKSGKDQADSSEQDVQERTEPSVSATPADSASTDTAAVSASGTATGTATPVAPQQTPAYMLNDIRPIPPFSRKLGLSDLIVSSINACDVDIRPNLANNIIITGGGSLLHGLTDRVNQDLSTSLAGLKIRIYAPGHISERSCSAWVGGSIVASLGTFHQLWVSKKEYDEVGPDKLLDRRFR